MNTPRISIVTAFLNEQENLPEFRRRISAALGAYANLDRELEYEVVLVDDHSTDGGAEMARQWAAEDPNVRYLRLSRNFGSHAAFAAGLAHCSGDAAVLLAADLQDPPETIAPLCRRWREGYDVVWAVRTNRAGEGLVSRILARAYYAMMRRLASRDIPAQGAGFVLLSRKVIDVYNAIPEKNTNFAFILTLLGFRQASIGFAKPPRHAGTSKWTLAKKMKIFVDSIVSFSHLPLRLACVLGVALALCGFTYAGVVIAGRLMGWVVAGTGYAALMTVLLIGQGAILTMLGVVGEYLWRVYDQVRGRPRYVIEEEFSSNNAILQISLAGAASRKAA